MPRCEILLRKRVLLYAGHGSGFRVNETGGNAKLGARYDVGTLGAACGDR